jgi:translation initiation factor 2 subunit 2
MALQEMLKDLAKKKKKKAPKKEGEDGGEDEKADGTEDLDMSALKKKKKKKPKAEDFEAKLAEVGGDAVPSSETPNETVVAEGDMEKGTGIWAHSSTDTIPYNLLLKRFFIQLHDRHPDLSGSSSKNTKIPPPQCLREGNKKTIFANLPDIAKRLKRSEEHVTQFLFAELGTNGSVDASRRLVIKGRFQSKQIEK